MKVIITEHQMKLIESAVAPKGSSERSKRVHDDKAALEDYIEKRGEYMSDITNGKKYLVQYLGALSKLVGRKYGMCAPVRSDGTYGAFYVKPMETFVKKSTGPSYRMGKPMKVKQNLYQRMGYADKM